MAEIISMALQSPVNFLGTMVLMFWVAICAAGVAKAIGPVVFINNEKESTK